MDLDDFESRAVGSQAKLKDHTPRATLRYFDVVWWVRTSRSARWMDLLGDYAGTEPFVLDGDSLIQMVLDDELLALGKPEDPSFQLAHALYVIERILKDFTSRSAVFDVVFWNQLRHLTIRTGDSLWVTQSRSLARALLIQQLQGLDIAVFHFDDLEDPKWQKYRSSRKPMFVMINDASILDRGEWSESLKAVLVQRTFIFDILASGISVTLLQGSEFRNSKILSFVFEQRFDPQARQQLSSVLWEVVVAAKTSLGMQEAVSPLISSPSNSLSDLDDGLRQVAKAFSSTDGDPISRTLVGIFTAHCIILPGIPISARAQRLSPLDDQLTRQLSESFLPNLFTVIASLLPLTTARWLDIDGRVFVSLLRFIMESDKSIDAAIGAFAAARLHAILSSAGIQMDLTSLRTKYALPPMAAGSEEDELPPPRPLLPFSHPVFNEDLADVNVYTEVQSSDDENAVDHMHFGEGTVFKDTAHWHNHKRAILPKYLGGEDPRPTDPWQRRKKMRRDQLFMARMNKHAHTLTGALGVQLQRQVIPLATRSGKQAKEPKRLLPPQVIDDTPAAAAREKKGKKEKEPKLSSADKLRQKIKAEKETKTVDELTVWWDDQLAKMSKMTLQDRITHVELLQRSAKAKEGWLSVEVRVFRLHLELSDWAQLDTQEDTVRDHYSVTIMRFVKDLYDMSPLSPTILGVLASVLMSLGFGDYVPSFEAPFETDSSKVDQSDRRLRFDFIKLIKSKSGSLVYKFMKIREHPILWQLRLFGEFMDRSMGGSTDRRVLFKPDAWQRKVLDCLDDADHSVLVVAPTSAGKTFISYYAMEKVLRDTNDGILVYVAPTKALVSQIAAEVYARFSKNLTSGSVWAVHTRDYRIHDPQHCQILVTVPEVLAIMLLSPPLARVWTPRIKRVILDEIHSIGQQEGGAVWEQIILLAPCPIIGLSATIGEPEKFDQWLGSVQKAHGYRHTLILHPHRYSHLRKFMYTISDATPDIFTGLDVHSSTRRSRLIHPISALSFGPRGLPADLALESADTLTLYRALASCQADLPNIDISSLDPVVFFAGKQDLLKQLDVINYETSLKDVLIEMMSATGTSGNASPLQKVIQMVEDPTLSGMSSSQLNKIPNKDVFKSNLIYLVSDLHVSGELPAILFSFDRSICEVIGSTLLEELVRAETNWKKDSPKWQRKMQQWEAWKGQAKERAREKARLSKPRKGNQDEDASAEPAELPDTSWEASFQPDDPLPQFSLAGVGKYSREELEADIKELRRWSGVADWILDALERGIGIHHAGMNKAYRSLIESLFRQGFVRVMIATGTLALGINAPAKTSVFLGDSPWLTALMYRQCAGRAGRRGFDLLGKVVFYGVAIDRVYRLMLSKLPSIGGNFPLTSTMTLRILNLLIGSDDAPVAVKAIRSLLTLPQISVSSNSGRDQILHHLRFSIDYLRRSKLLDANGAPLNLYGIAAHLYYTEPANLALVALFRAGVLHKICNSGNIENAKKELVILLANLFGRRYLPRAFFDPANLEEVTKRSPSIVVLPPMNDHARQVLVAHDNEIRRVFTDYAVSYVAKHQDTLGEDKTLPMSQQSLGCEDATLDNPFLWHLKRNSISVRVRSPFIATSGLSDRFESVDELTQSVRAGLHLEKNAIPTMGEFTGSDRRRGVDRSQILNAYLYDFYMHGQTLALEKANGIRRGEVWYALQEFDLVLMTIRGVIEQLLLRAEKAEDDEDETQNASELDSQSIAPDSGYGTGSVDTSVADEDIADGPELKRPRMVSDRDWNVYLVVDAALREFNTKFKEMWA